MCSKSDSSASLINQFLFRFSICVEHITIIPVSQGQDLGGNLDPAISLVTRMDSVSWYCSHLFLHTCAHGHSQNLESPAPVTCSVSASNSFSETQQPKLPTGPAGDWEAPSPPQLHLRPPAPGALAPVRGSMQFLQVPLPLRLLFSLHGTVFPVGLVRIGYAMW